MGFFYLGPIDGHNFDHLIPVLKNIKSNKIHKPIFLHVITKKGKGYIPAENSYDKFHGVNKFDIKTGEQENILKIHNSKISRPYVFDNNMYLIKNNAIVKIY